MRNKAESPQQGGLPDDPHGLPTGQLLRGHGGRVASLRPVPRLRRLEGFGRVRYVIVIGLEGHVSTNIKTRLSNRIAGWDGLVQENVAGAILAATFAHRSFDPSSGTSQRRQEYDYDRSFDAGDNEHLCRHTCPYRQHCELLSRVVYGLLLVAESLMFESPHHPREKLLYRHIPGLLRYKFYSRESCSDISSIPTMPVVATMDTNSLSTCLPGSSNHEAWQAFRLLHLKLRSPTALKISYQAFCDCKLAAQRPRQQSRRSPKLRQQQLFHSETG